MRRKKRVKRNPRLHCSTLAEFFGYLILSFIFRWKNSTICCSGQSKKYDFAYIYRQQQCKSQSGCLLYACIILYSQCWKLSNLVTDFKREKILTLKVGHHLQPGADRHFWEQPICFVLLHDAFFDRCDILWGDLELKKNWNVLFMSCAILFHKTCKICVCVFVGLEQIYVISNHFSGENQFNVTSLVTKQLKLVKCHCIWHLKEQWNIQYDKIKGSS